MKKLEIVQNPCETWEKFQLGQGLIMSAQTMQFGVILTLSNLILAINYGLKNKEFNKIKLKKICSDLVESKLREKIDFRKNDKEKIKSLCDQIVDITLKNYEENPTMALDHLWKLLYSIEAVASCTLTQQFFDLKEINNIRQMTNSVEDAVQKICNNQKTVFKTEEKKLLDSNSPLKEVFLSFSMWLEEDLALSKLMKYRKECYKQIEKQVSQEMEKLKEVSRNSVKPKEKLIKKEETPIPSISTNPNSKFSFSVVDDYFDKPSSVRSHKK